MDTIDPARFVFASLVVLGLIGLLAVFLKYYSQKTFGQKFTGKLFAANQITGRIAIVETYYIDHKTKLVLLKRDDIEHLLVISDGKAIVIESGIESGK